MSGLSRADLLRVLKAKEEQSIKQDVEELAILFQYSYDENRMSPTVENSTVGQDQEIVNNLDQSPAIYAASRQYQYWYVAECKAKMTDKIADDIIMLPQVEDTELADRPLASYSLMSPGQWQNLWDKYLTNPNLSQVINIPCAVKLIAKGQAIHRLPKVISKRWNKPVVLILDRTKELRPLWPDMRAAWLSLLALLGEEQLQTFYLAEGPQGCWAQPQIVADGGIDSMAHDATVVMMGAFGSLETGKLSDDWSNLHDQLVKRGHSVVMLSVNRIHPSNAKVHLLDSRPGQSTDKLLTALALAWKPSLNQLRHLRLAIQDASLLDELKVYNHKEVEQLGGHLNLKPGVLLQRLHLLEDLDETDSLKQCARQWQQSLSKTGKEIERLQRNLLSTLKVEDYRLLHGLAKVVQKEIKEDKDRRLPYSLMRSMLPLLQLLTEQNPGKAWEPLLSVAQTIALEQDRPLPLKHQGLQSQGAIRWLRQINQQLVLNENKNNALLPLGDQAYCVQTQKIIRDSLAAEVKELEIIDQGHYWQLHAMTQPDWSDRFWQDEKGLFATHIDNALFFLQPATVEKPQAQWICRYKPWSWASEVGIDEHGLWADLQVKQVNYRLRWIKPGQFMMGSPITEKERSNNETQHQVTLTQGYWLGETSCTQGLWQAVMDSNPMLYKEDLQFPVKQVSWNDCQKFVKRLLILFPDFSAQLPSEAQWEYACRAGTKTAYWWGDKMDKIYANNGTDRNLEIQYPANDFGLKSMSGNVYEWCGDWMNDYATKNQIDPVGSETGQDRVLRGGSWSNHGRFLRSAYRDAEEPDFRYFLVGFRLAGGLDPQASEQYCATSRGPWNGQAAGGIVLGENAEQSETGK